MSNTQKCYLDSNFLVYLKNEDAKEHEAALAILKNLFRRDFGIYISSLCLDEFIYVVNHLLQKPQNERTKVIKTVLREMLSLPNLEIINGPTDKDLHLSIPELMEKYTLKPRDAYHLLIMKYNQIKHLATFDNDFKKVFKNKEIMGLVKS